jgi:hypothetical protein
MRATTREPRQYLCKEVHIDICLKSTLEFFYEDVLSQSKKIDRSSMKPQALGTVYVGTSACSCATMFSNDKVAWAYLYIKYRRIRDIASEDNRDGRKRTSQPLAYTAPSR